MLTLGDIQKWFPTGQLMKYNNLIILELVRTDKMARILLRSPILITESTPIHTHF